MRRLIADTTQEEAWQSFKGHRQLRSWLCVPLIASEEFLGFLSAGHNEPNRYTQEHLRRAELLAIPAAAAIQNARLYQTARIYGEELEKRLADLKQAEAALAQVQGDRQVSEEKFQKVFRSSPIPFSITTLKEGRFLDVNGAFEQRYGYSRAEALGHTVHELRIWEDAADRVRMVAQLERSGPIRNVITRLRTKSGEIKLTAVPIQSSHELWATHVLQVVLFSLLSTALLLAQSTGGRILGRVADPSAAVLAGVKVTLVNDATGASSDARTNENGDYVFPQVTVGSYRLEFEQTGFKKNVQRSVTVSLNQVVTVNMVMQIGETKETVE